MEAKKTTAKERVEEEAAQLEERVKNLRSFITNNEKYYKLREADQYLLRRQLEIMQEYLDILIARMSIWREV